MEGAKKKCPKCTQHLKVPVLKAKGHKQFCPYSLCQCQNCLKIEQNNHRKFSKLTDHNRSAEELEESYVGELVAAVAQQGSSSQVNVLILIDFSHGEDPHFY